MLFSRLGAVLAVGVLFALGGCFSPSTRFPKGEAAYAVMPPIDPAGVRTPYRIGVLDKISVRVFQEPDLSFDELQVDAAGNITYPLIGQLTAEGKTPIELGQEIAHDLEAGGYIRLPQVVVGVVESSAQRVVVEGNVNKPGVYEIAGNTTLLESIARAEGLTRLAVVNEVVVLRAVDGKQMGAVFNLRQIREGKAPDPEILGGDKIVVGFSALKGTYRDILQAAPLFNVFRAIY